MKKQKKTTSWGGVAAWYDALLEGDTDSYQAQVILPNFLRMMAIRKQKRVLDIACGQGFFTKAFAVAGATAIGIDIAPELIARARKNAHGAEFLISSAEHMPKIKTASFDIATIVLALQNIEHPNRVIGEVARVLVPRGRLYIVLNHPAFRIPQKSSWEFDEGRAIQYRRIDRYISESHANIITHPSAPHSAYTVSFHRPLQFYFKLFAKNGFLVHRLEEWTSHKRSLRGPRQAAEDRARKEIPLFLAIEATKTIECQRELKDSSPPAGGSE